MNNYYNYFPNNNCVEVYKLLSCILCHLSLNNYFMTDWFCSVLFGFIKHTEDREEGMDVEEGEMGDDEAPTTW